MISKENTLKKKKRRRSLFTYNQGKQSNIEYKMYISSTKSFTLHIYNFTALTICKHEQTIIYLSLHVCHFSYLNELLYDHIYIYFPPFFRTPITKATWIYQRHCYEKTESSAQGYYFKHQNKKCFARDISLNNFSWAKL